MINPLENFNENTAIEFENVVNQYYDLVRKSNVENNTKLNTFLDYDLETYVSENGNLTGLDLQELLGVGK